MGFSHPYGANDQRTDFAPNRVAVEKIGRAACEAVALTN